MNFNKHLEIKGTHAAFSPSQSAWLRYDDDKIVEKLTSLDAATIGTELHEFANLQIILRMKYSSIKDLSHSLLTRIGEKYWDKDHEEITDYGKKLIKLIGNIPKEVLSTVRLHINDAIGFRMEPEQRLYYSEYIYGTADAISFRDGILRIHDLKTGKLPVHMEQLMIYAAIFCLEYNVNPTKISTHLRIYQNNDILLCDPEPEEIQEIINRLMYIKDISKKVSLEA